MPRRSKSKIVAFLHRVHIVPAATINVVDSIVYYVGGFLYAFAAFFIFLAIYVNIFRPYDLFDARPDCIKIAILAGIVLGISYIVRYFDFGTNTFKKRDKSKSLSELWYYICAVSFVVCLISLLTNMGVYEHWSFLGKIVKLPVVVDNGNFFELVFGIVFVIPAVTFLFIASALLVLLVMWLLYWLLSKNATGNFVKDLSALNAATEKHKILDIFTSIVQAFFILALPIWLMMYLDPAVTSGQSFWTAIGHSPSELYDKYVAISLAVLGLPLYYYGRVLFTPKS